MINRMQKINISIILVIFTVLTSCEFNQSVNKDLITGAYSRGNGIGFDDVSILINGKEEKRNEFIYGEKIEFKFNNITGLKRIDEMAYPDLSMFIVKNETDTVLSLPNSLKNLENGTDLNPLQLRANFVSALPHKNNETYTVHINIWDKKGEGTFSYKLPFTVIESDILDIEKNGIEYSNIYLWNETLKEPVFNKTVSSKHQFILILEGISGLKEDEDMVFPIFSIDMQDRNKNSIMSSPNLLNYDDNGVNSKNIKKQLVAKITFPQNQIDNPCTLIAKINDKNSSNQIEIITELHIE